MGRGAGENPSELLIAESKKLIVSSLNEVCDVAETESQVSADQLPSLLKAKTLLKQYRQDPASVTIDELGQAGDDLCADVFPDK